MAWLRGSTDIAHVVADLYSLLSGGLAAAARGSGQSGNGITVAAPDAWAGIDAANAVIRSPTYHSTWRAPIKCWRGMPRFMWMASPVSSLTDAQMQMGSPTFSGAYSGGQARELLLCWVSTVNTAAGNLAGTVVSYRWYNPATLAINSSGTLTTWSGSSQTKVISQGVSITLTLGGGDQFLNVGAIAWFRLYGTAHPQGIDFIPEFGSLVTGSQVVSTTSGGANAYAAGGTDYTVVAEIDFYPWESMFISMFDFGGRGAGRGIEWNNSSGGAAAVGATYYIVSANLYDCFLQITWANNLYLVLTPMTCWDSTRLIGSDLGAATQSQNTGLTTIGNNNAEIAQLFSASQGTTVYINYWISVKQDKIVIVGQGDPGNAGYLDVLTAQKYTPIDATNDKWPWIVAGTFSNANFAGSIAAEPALYAMNYWGSQLYGASGSATHFSPWGTAQALEIAFVINEALSNPVSMNRAWVLYGLLINSNYLGEDFGGAFSVVLGKAGLRGVMRGIFNIANQGWANKDELTDGSSTYLLVASQLAFYGQTTTTPIYMAILEE